MNILDLIKEFQQKFPKLEELIVNYNGSILLEYDFSEVTPSELRNIILEDADFQLLFDSIINSTLINLEEECNGFIQIGFTEPWAYVKYYGINTAEDEAIEIEDSFDIDLTSDIL